MAGATLYPDYLLPIVANRLVETQDDEFDVIREQLLLGYGYQTARAYWRDLEDWHDWCIEQKPIIDPLNPPTTDIARFLAERLSDGYSPNTVARRRTALRLLYDVLHMNDNPARRTKPVSVAGRVGFTD